VINKKVWIVIVYGGKEDGKKGDRGYVGREIKRVDNVYTYPFPYIPSLYPSTPFTFPILLPAPFLPHNIYPLTF
jgi:hypothetical protein